MSRSAPRETRSWSQYLTMRDGVKIAVDVHLPKGYAWIDVDAGSMGACAPGEQRPGRPGRPRLDVGDDRGVEGCEAGRRGSERRDARPGRAGPRGQLRCLLPGQGQHVQGRRPGGGRLPGHDGSPLAADKVETFVVDMLPTSYLFRKGHALRLAVAFADLDNFAPSAGPSRVEVHRGGDCPSRIELPRMG